VEKPPVLEYRTPQELPARRRRATSAAIGVGIVNVLFATALMMTYLSAFDSFSRFGIFALHSNAQVLIWAIVSGVCGICFIIGGAFIRQPDRFWEIALLICLVVQALALLAMMGWVIITDESFMPAQLVFYLTQTFCLFPLARSVRQIGRGDKSGLTPSSAR
jgi:hypothetical protein